jgi:hypothetical protein
MRLWTTIPPISRVMRGDAGNVGVLDQRVDIGRPHSARVLTQDDTS